MESGGSNPLGVASSTPSAGSLVVEVATAGGGWTTLEATALDEASLSHVVTAAAQLQDSLTVHRLRPGQRYRIVHDFLDHYGNAVAAKDELTFVAMNFLPQEDGYTLRFVERTLWLQGSSVAHHQFGRNVVAIDGQ